MLEFFRRGVKTWVAKGLLLLLILSFAVWGLDGLFAASSGGTVARVGETEVPASQFANNAQRTQQLISRQQGALIPLSELRANGLDDQILRGLVRDAAFAEELASLEIAIPDAAIADAIRDNPAFQDGQGAFSQFLFANTLSQRGFDTREFEGLTGKLLGQQVLIDAIATGIPAPDARAETIAKWRGEQRTIHTVTLTPDMAPDPGTPDAAALEAFFQADSTPFREPERRWGRALMAEIAVLAEKTKPTDAEIRAEYDANIERYSLPATRTVDQLAFQDAESAEAAAARLADGSATFEEIAAERNVPLSDLSLGTVRADELPAATSEAVFALTEPGAAGPVQTPFGFALLNVTDVDEGGITPFEAVKPALTATLARQRATAAARDMATRIDDLRTSGLNLDEVAEQTGLRLVAFEGLAADGTVADGTPPAAVADPAFMAEVLEALDQEERNVVPLSDGSYALVMIDTIEAAHLPELEAITDTVTAAWQAEQRLLALEARAAELTGSNADLAAIATETGTQVTERSAFRRIAPPRNVSAALIQRIFSAPEGALVSGRDGTDTGVLIARVEQIEPLEGEALAEERQAAKDAMERAIAGDTLELYARALEDRHGATINRDVIEEIYIQLGAAQGGQPGAGL